MFKVGMLTILVAVSVAHGNDVFEHELNSFPSQNRDCGAIAQDLSQQFSKAAQVEIYWAGGKKTSDTECDIKLSYVADERLTLPATIDRGSLSAAQWRGVYLNFNECEKYLGFEKELFTKETGLSPWISFCAGEHNVVGKTTYYPVVEAIGTPIKMFFGSESIVGATPLIGWERGLKEIKEGAEARGVAVPTIHGYSIGGAFEVRMRFYTKERNWVINDKFGKFSQPSTCEQQVERIKSSFSKVQIPPLAALCAIDFEGYTLDIVNLTPDIIKTKPLWEKIDPKTYSSLTNCLSQVEQTEKVYTEKFNKKVMAGFCFDSAPSSFQIMILEDSFRR